VRLSTRKDASSIIDLYGCATGPVVAPINVNGSFADPSHSHSLCVERYCVNHSINVDAGGTLSIFYCPYPGSYLSACLPNDDNVQPVSHTALTQWRVAILVIRSVVATGRIHGSSGR
jgi:hypothetical protein